MFSAGFPVQDERMKAGNEMLFHVLHGIDTPLTQLFDTIQNVSGYTVMNNLPGFADQPSMPLPVLFSIEIESYCKNQLRLCRFTHICYRGTDIHGKDADRISTGTLIKQVARIIKIKWIGTFFYSDGVEEKQGDQVKAKKTLHEFERVLSPSERLDPDPFQIILNPVHPGDMIWPAG
jgi:hypothetical protein